MEISPPTPQPTVVLTPEMQELIDIWTEAGVPDPLMKYLGLTCSIVDVKTFLDYIIRKDMEAEWKEIVDDTFPVSADFPRERQRLYVSKLRGSYRVALELEDQVAEKKAKKTKEEEETDMEKPLSSEGVRVLKKRHGDRSMIGTLPSA